MNERALLASDGASAQRMSYETLLSLLGDKDRASMERQIAAYETKFGAAAALRWRGLACALARLAPARPKVAGSNIMQFFVPDGVYRKQVFACRAIADGAFTVYAPDVLEQAVQVGLLSRQVADDEPSTYHLPPSDDILAIDALNNRTPDPDAFYKDLTGWNRKAVRITLPADASEAQVEATKQLCALAATQWA